MYYIYAITTRSKDKIYVGITRDVKARLKEHNSGRTKYTKGYKPWYLFYSELVKDRPSARIREKKLKSGCGKEFLKKTLLNYSRAHSSIG